MRANPEVILSMSGDWTVAQEKDVSYGRCVRYVCKVVVDREKISRPRLHEIAEAVLGGLKRKKKLNALGILFYGLGHSLDGGYTVALADWAPFGDWTRASGRKAGDYSSHEWRWEWAGVKEEA